MGKDAFDLLSVMEVHNALFSSHVNAKEAGGINRDAFKDYMKTVDMAIERVRQMHQDGNAGAYYKVAGEFKAFASEYGGATDLLAHAIELFRAEPDQSKVTGLVDNCMGLLTFCLSQSKTTPATAP